MGFDYVYDVNRMIDLAGGDLASKRQAKNRFLRNYAYRVEPYSAARHLRTAGSCWINGRRTRMLSTPTSRRQRRGRGHAPSG